MGKLSAVEMLADKYDQKAILKEKEIELKKMEYVAVSSSEIWERIGREKAATGTGDAGTKGNVGHSKQDEVIALLSRNNFMIDLHI